VHRWSRRWYSVCVTVASGSESWSRKDFSIPTLNQIYFITAMDRCFNARHRSSKSVSARKTLITAQRKFVQRSSDQDFCVGLADQSVHELTSSGSILLLSVVIATVNFVAAENWPFLTARNMLCCQNFRSGRRDHKRWPSVYGISLTVANVCWTVTSGDELFSPPWTLQHRSFGGTKALNWTCLKQQHFRQRVVWTLWQRSGVF